MLYESFSSFFPSLFPLARAARFFHIFGACFGLGCTKSLYSCSSYIPIVSLRRTLLVLLTLLHWYNSGLCSEIPFLLTVFSTEPNMSKASCKCKAAFCDTCHTCSRCTCKCRKKRPRGRPRKEPKDDGESRALRARSEDKKYSDTASDDDAACSADADASYSPFEQTERAAKRTRKISEHDTVSRKRNIIGQICAFANLGSANAWTLPSEQSRNVCSSLSDLTSSERNRVVHFASEMCRKMCALLLPNCSNEVFLAIVKKSAGDSKLSPDERILASSKIALNALPKELLQRTAIDSVMGSALVSDILFDVWTVSPHHMLIFMRLFTC